MAPEPNRVLGLEASDALFNKRDYAAAKRFWPDRHIQHGAHIPLGRAGDFGHCSRDRYAILAATGKRPRRMPIDRNVLKPPG